MLTTHDAIAQRIATMKGVRYNQGKGPDIITPREAIEVETVNTIADARRQFQGYRRPVYVAGADDVATQAALEHYKGTDIGVMDPFGNILRDSKRPSYRDLPRDSTRKK
jgi:hypothetical protein